MLKTIYYSRIALLFVPVLATVLLASSARDSWGAQLSREEFKAVVEKHEDAFRTIREEHYHMRQALIELQIANERSIQRQSFLDQKFETAAKILWAICSLLVVQVLIPLLRMGLRSELTRVAAKTPPPYKNH